MSNDYKLLMAMINAAEDLELDIQWAEDDHGDLDKVVTIHLSETYIIYTFIDGVLDNVEMQCK